MTGLPSMAIAAALEALAARTPAPGGGAVAGVTGALAASLGRMVGAYSTKKSAEPTAVIAKLNAALLAAQTELLRLAEDDERAFGELSRLMRLEKDDPERLANWSTAVGEVLGVPEATAQAGLAVMRALGDAASEANQRLDSDLAIAAILAEACVAAAAWNVRANLSLTDDAADWAARAESWIADAKTMRGEIEAVIAPRTLDTMESTA